MGQTATQLAAAAGAAGHTGLSQTRKQPAEGTLHSGRWAMEAKRCP